MTAASSRVASSPDRGVNALLPNADLGQVVLPPRKPGAYEYEFTCGSGVLRGRLVVTPTEPPRGVD